jgi:hypothetical protein
MSKALIYREIRILQCRMKGGANKRKKELDIATQDWYDSGARRKKPKGGPIWEQSFGC